jgi:hypothetical protein
MRTPYRYSSAFNRQYPWRNRLILHQGRLLTWVQKNRPQDCPPDVLHLIEVSVGCRPKYSRSNAIQDIAHDVDEFDFNRVWSHGGHHMLKKRMSRPVSSADPLKIDSAESSLIGQLYLSYLLLDMLVWAHDWPHHPSHRVMQPVSPPASTTVPQHFTDIISRFLRPSSAPLNHTPVPPTPEPPHISPESETLLAVNAVRNFSLAHRCSLFMEKYDMMSLLHALAFILACFRPVRRLLSHAMQRDPTHQLQSESRRIPEEILKKMKE